MNREKLISRAGEGLASRWQRLLDAWHRRFIFRGPEQVIRWRWPWPLKKPWQRRRLRIASEGGGIGDELMCTAVLREIRRLNPQCHITFLSRYPGMFAGNPHVNVVEPVSPDTLAGAIILRYGVVLPPPRPLVSLMAEDVGLKLSVTQLDPPQVNASPELEARMARINRPRVVIQPQSSRWTPNKQWPLESWKRLIEMLVEHVDVIEVGIERAFAGEDFGPRFHSAAGTTTMQEFGWVISQATVFVGPPSGGMHLANAFRVPSVIIFGGYEVPEGYDYPLARRFYTPVDCAPCWLETPCPYDWKCLRAISPEQVFQAVRAAVPQALLAV